MPRSIHWSGSPALGDRVNVSVADVITGQTLFAKGADDGTVPASVTKLVTAVTVLAARGPGHRIPTRAVAGAKAGEVVIIGGGDPTLAINKKGYYPGAARLDDLAAQVRTALGGTPPTSVTVDGSLYSGPVYGPGWDDDIPTGGSGGAVTALMTDGARTDPGVEPRLRPAVRRAGPGRRQGVRPVARGADRRRAAWHRTGPGPGRGRRHPGTGHRVGRGAVSAADPARRRHDQRERQPGG